MIWIIIYWLILLYGNYNLVKRVLLGNFKKVELNYVNCKCIWLVMKGNFKENLIKFF